MIFETLVAAADKGELLLVDGGLCHWHLRRDGQLTIYELIVLPERRRQGIGRRILGRLDIYASYIDLATGSMRSLPITGGAGEGG